MLALGSPCKARGAQEFNAPNGVSLDADSAKIGARRSIRRALGSTHVAVPIFEPVIQAAWAHAMPKAALAPPSPEAKRQLACKSVDPESDEIAKGGRKAITECVRVDAKGKVINTQYRLVSHEE